MSSFMATRPVQESAAASAMPEHPLVIDKLLQKLFIYTVGRGNPPHEGHMATIMAAIELAIQYNGKALILLGNGAANTIGTIENPLDFTLKKAIIEAHIPKEYASFYEIQMMSKFPTSDIIMFVGKHKDDTRTPYIYHLTANKAGKGNEKSDSEKLAFINKYLKKDAGFETGSHAITPKKTEDEDISATSIRKFAVNQTREAFIEKYSGFYGEDMAGTVYDTINTAYEDSEKQLKEKYLYNESKPTSSKKARFGGGIRKGGTRKHKSGTRKRKNKRKGGTLKRTSRVHR